MSRVELVARLSDPRQAVRDAAADSLREAIARDPAAAGDSGRAFWELKLASIPIGITPAELESLSGGAVESGVASGQSEVLILRLDDYWVIDAYFDLTDALAPGRVVAAATAKLLGLGRLSRRVRQVWVEPGEGFTGPWRVYYANGVLSCDRHYERGACRRSTDYHDDGRLADEQEY